MHALPPKLRQEISTRPACSTSTHYWGWEEICMRRMRQNVRFISTIISFLVNEFIFFCIASPTTRSCRHTFVACTKTASHTFAKFVQRHSRINRYLNDTFCCIRTSNNRGYSVTFASNGMWCPAYNYNCDDWSIIDLWTISGWNTRTAFEATSVGIVIQNTSATCAARYHQTVAPCAVINATCTLVTQHTNAPYARRCSRSR